VKEQQPQSCNTERFGRFVCVTWLGIACWLAFGIHRAPGAVLNGSFQALAGGTNINLTAVGTLDWVHWGLGGGTNVNRKLSATPRISGTVIGVGANPILQLTTNLTGTSWSDGTPTLTVTHSPIALFVRGLTNGFALTTSADMTRRRLFVYVGANAAAGLFSAALSDGSAPNYFDESLASTMTLSNGVFVVDFAAASDGQALTVRFTSQSVVDPVAGFVSLQAVALASNLAPTAQIVSPTNNAKFPKFSAITISAQAADTDGSVQQVQFYQGATLLGDAFAPPYEFFWDTVNPGTYSLTARAMDNDGAVSISAPVTITVLSNAAPSVVLTNPPDFANFFVPAMIPLEATASDSDGSIAKVEFYAGNIKLGEVIASPYTLIWTNPAAGEYFLTARAIDNEGAIKTSTSVNVLVTQTGGYLTVAAATLSSTVDLENEGPADWAHWGLFNEESFNHKRGVASQINDFSLLGGGSAYPFADNANGYSWTDGIPTVSATNTPTGVYNVGLKGGFRLQLPAGLTTNTVKVYVGAYAARGRLLAYLSDFSAPVVSDLSVENFSSGPSTVYTLQYAAASSARVLNLRYFVDSMHAGDGNVTLQAAAFDTGNRPPSAAVASPAHGAICLWPTNITITANASDADGSITNVEFFRDGVKLGQKSIAPYTLVWSNATLGSHVLTVRATDNKGVSFTSRAADVFISTGGGLLAASSAFPAAQVDLDAEGPVDWTHWGLTRANSFDHRNGATTRISNANRIGSGQTKNYTDNFSGFSWTNGTPTPSVASSTTGIYAEGLGEGFQITAPADMTRRQLKVYVGLFASRARFEAYLTDYSARSYVDTSLLNVYGNNYRVYTIDYQSATANQQLVVRHTAQESFDTLYGNVTLQSASLAELPPFRLGNSGLEGDSFHFSVATLTSKSYQVQVSEVMPTTNWQTFATFPGTGLEVWVTNSPLIATQRFYRVVEY